MESRKKKDKTTLQGTVFAGVQQLLTFYGTAPMR